MSIGRYCKGPTMSRYGWRPYVPAAVRRTRALKKMDKLRKKGLDIKPVEIESSIRKALVILKMRGSDHDKHLREFEITPNGIRITSTFQNYEGITTGTPRRVGSEKFLELMRGASEKRK